MVLVCAIVPALMLCLAILYIMLLRRFFLVKAKLPVLGVRGVLGRTEGKRRKIAAWAALFLVVCLTAQLAASAWAPGMLMVFSYEEAARGQNPNVTRFNESNILSDDILEQVIQRGGLGISVEQLSKCLSISTSLDAEKLDVTQESDMKISTEYRVYCSGRAALYGTEPKTVLNLLADVYWEKFVLNYAENDSILDLSFEKLEGMEYLDAKDYLEMQANKLRNYLPGYSSESSSFRAADSEETFSSLSQKISNFIEIELERYEAFVLEKGLADNRTTYQSRMQYVNHQLDVSRRKEMASHDVRIEAINMYNAYMTRFVLIPTYDTDKEFYMSKTKVGVDYFADEAKEHLESATELVEKIEHNTYAGAVQYICQRKTGRLHSGELCRPCRSGQRPEGASAHSSVCGRSGRKRCAGSLLPGIPKGPACRAERQPRSKEAGGARHEGAGRIPLSEKIPRRHRRPVGSGGCRFLSDCPAPYSAVHCRHSD